MLTQKQFEAAKGFIFRHGRLLDRKYFQFHFANGSRDEVLQVLSCYQNPDGGFGYGLEPDVMCPASTGICMEIGMAYLEGLGVTEGEIVDRAESGTVGAQQEDGSMRPPEAEVRAIRTDHGGRTTAGAGAA